MNSKFVISAVAALGSLLVVAGCGGKAAQPQMPPAMVTVATPQKQEIVESAEFTGRIEPEAIVEKGFRSLLNPSGHEMKVMVNIG